MRRIIGFWGRMIGRYGWRVLSRADLHTTIDAPLPAGPAVWIGWHEANLITISLHRRIRGRPVVAFVPPGPRGQAMEGWLRDFGVVPVPVSGDAQDGLALRTMRRSLKAGSDVLIAVDGPHGPRREVRPGALWLAAIGDAPVIPVGCAASPSIRLPRWDRHIVPLARARVAVVCGEALGRHIDPRSEGATERLAKILDALMDRAAIALDAPPAVLPDLDDDQAPIARSS